MPTKFRVGDSVIFTPYSSEGVVIECPVNELQTSYVIEFDDGKGSKFNSICSEHNLELANVDDYILKKNDQNELRNGNA